MTDDVSCYVDSKIQHVTCQLTPDCTALTCQDMPRWHLPRAATGAIRAHQGADGKRGATRRFAHRMGVALLPLAARQQPIHERAARKEKTNF